MATVEAAVKDVIGASASSGDQEVLNYIVSLLEDDSFEDAEETFDTLGPLLVSGWIFCADKIVLIVRQCSWCCRDVCVFSEKKKESLLFFGQKKKNFFLKKEIELSAFSIYSHFRFQDRESTAIIVRDNTHSLCVVSHRLMNLFSFFLFTGCWFFSFCRLIGCGGVFFHLQRLSFSVCVVFFISGVWCIIPSS